MREYYIIYKNDCYEYQRNHGADETHYDGKIHSRKLNIYSESDDMIIAESFYLVYIQTQNNLGTPFFKKDAITIESLADMLDHITCKVNTCEVGCAGIFYCNNTELQEILNILEYHTEREKLIYIIGQISKFAHSIKIERKRYTDTICEYNEFKKIYKDDIDKIINETKKYNLEDYLNEIIPVLDEIK